MTDTDTETTPVVLTERRGSVLLITLNRPEVRNAVNAALAHGVAAALDELDADDERRAVLPHVTAFHGPPQPVRGLGLLPFSNCVHHDAEPARRRDYHRFVARGMCAGFGVDEGAALRFEGTELAEVVTTRESAQAYRVEGVGGGVVETPLPARYLGVAVADAVAVVAA